MGTGVGVEVRKVKQDRARTLLIRIYRRRRRTSSIQVGRRARRVHTRRAIEYTSGITSGNIHKKNRRLYTHSRPHHAAQDSTQESESKAKSKSWREITAAGCGLQAKDHNLFPSTARTRCPRRTLHLGSRISSRRQTQRHRRQRNIHPNKPLPLPPSPSPTHTQNNSSHITLPSPSLSPHSNRFHLPRRNHPLPHAATPHSLLPPSR